MRDLQNLLNQVSIITRKNAEFLDATGGRFNIFRISGVNHYENVHSAILAELLNPKGSHGLKGKFLQAFLDRIILKEDIKDLDCVRAHVKTEAHTEDGRIDILIEDNKGHAIIIENKIYANDQGEQLKRYHAHATKVFSEKFQIFYLTLNGGQASENSGGGIDYTQISYAEDIILWLEECVNLSARFPLVRETISQYINHIKQLTNQDMDKKNQEELIEILSKPENIESAIRIGENIRNVKVKLVTDMVKNIAEKYCLEFEVTNDANGFHFFKNEWKKGAGIWYGEFKGMTFYAIKTAEACNGKAKLQQRIIELFELEPIPWDPYGFGIIKKDFWKNNSELFIQMANGSLAAEVIIPSLKKVLNYMKDHTEIENELS